MGKITPLDWYVVKAYADHNMRSRAAARDLSMSYATFKFHLSKVKRRTGLDPRCFGDLEILIETYEGNSTAVLI